MSPIFRTWTKKLLIHYRLSRSEHYTCIIIVATMKCRLTIDNNRKSNSTWYFKSRNSKNSNRWGRFRGGTVAIVLSRASLSAKIAQLTAFVNHQKSVRPFSIWFLREKINIPWHRYIDHISTSSLSTRICTRSSSLKENRDKMKAPFPRQMGKFVHSGQTCSRLSKVGGAIRLTHCHAIRLRSE